MYLCAESGARRGVALKAFWVDRNHPGFCVFHFDGVASINDAGETARAGRADSV
jgi:hypothetical protein